MSPDAEMTKMTEALTGNVPAPRAAAVGEDDPALPRSVGLKGGAELMGWDVDRGVERL